MNAIQTVPMTLAEFREVYHVSQLTHEGTWHWRRINGCLNTLSRGFRTQGAAERDRDSSYAVYRNEVLKYGETSMSR